MITLKGLRIYSSKRGAKYEGAGQGEKSSSQKVQHSYCFGLTILSNFHNPGAEKVFPEMLPGNCAACRQQPNHSSAACIPPLSSLEQHHEEKMPSSSPQGGEDSKVNFELCQGDSKETFFEHKAKYSEALSNEHIFWMKDWFYLSFIPLPPISIS